MKSPSYVSELAGLGITTSPLDSPGCAPRPAAAVVQQCPEYRGSQAPVLRWTLQRELPWTKADVSQAPGLTDLSGDLLSTQSLDFLLVWVNAAQYKGPRHLPGSILQILEWTQC